jgi:hypothetical protein
VEVRSSSEVNAPHVFGIRRPLVLMPADAAFTPDDRFMAIGHELMHVKRRDLALGWIPAIAERLFFFHPLVRVAAREYVTAREAACDAALVRALGVAPEEYGRLLVRFGIAGQRFAWGASGAAGSATSLRRRLEMLQHLSGHSRGAAGLAVAVLVIALVPGRLVARSAPPVDVSTVTDAIDLAHPVTVTPSDLASQAQRAPSVRQVPAVKLRPVQAPFASAASQAPVPTPNAERAASPEPPASPERAQPPAPTQLDALRETLADALRAVREAELGKTAAAERRRQDLDKLQQQLADRAKQADLITRERAAADQRAREEIQEVERRLQRAQKEQESRQQTADKLLADQPAGREDVLRQRLEEMSRRLEQISNMQRELERAINLRQRDLGAVR